MACSVATYGDGCQTLFANGTVAIEQIKGLCVQVAGVSAECWDVCDLNHEPQDYLVPSPSGTGFSQSFPLMVAQIRMGKHPVRCENVLTQVLTMCEPGARCTTVSIQRDQGMCVSVPNEGNQCLDMCDHKISLETFGNTLGHQEGTRSIVERVRSGHDDGPFPVTCPGIQWWMWLWIPLLLICCIGGCLLCFYAKRFMMSRKRKYRETETVDYPEPEPYQDQYAPEADYRGEGEFRAMEEQRVYEEPPPIVREEVPVVVQEPMPVVEYTTAAPAVTYTTAPQTTSTYLYGGAPYTTSMQAQQPLTTVVPSGASMYSTSGAVYTAAQPTSFQPATIQMPMPAGNPMFTIPPQ